MVHEGATYLLMAAESIVVSTSSTRSVSFLVPSLVYRRASVWSLICLCAVPAVGVSGESTVVILPLAALGCCGVSASC